MEKIIIKSYEDYENDEREIGDDPIYDSPFITNAWDDDSPFSPEALVEKYKSADYTFNTDTITIYKILGEDIYSMYEDGDDVIDWSSDVPDIKADTIFYVLKSDELCDEWKNREDNASKSDIFFRVWYRLLNMIDDTVEDDDEEDDDD